MSKPSFKKTIKSRKLKADYNKKKALARHMPVTSQVEIPKLKSKNNEKGEPMVAVIGKKMQTLKRPLKPAQLPPSKKFKKSKKGVI